MYHVLLVDDEDGQQALEIMEKKHIDLLITDIKMPHMDGIRLLHMVKNMKPNTRCILLTAYSDFEYAKEAINIGVENYLLKPVKREELERTIQKALDNLYRGRRNAESLLRENVLQRWIGGRISESELSDRAAVLQLNVYLPQYCVICFEKMTTPFYDYLSICMEVLQTDYEVYVFQDEKERCVMIIGGRGLEIKTISDKLSSVRKRFDEQKSIRVAIGSVAEKVDEVHLSYKMASESMEMLQITDTEMFRENDYMDSEFGTDVLVEEIRFLLFENDEKIRRTGLMRFIAKIYHTVKNGQTDKGLMWLIGICTKVLTSEFPQNEGIWKPLADKKWKIVEHMSKEEFTKEAEEILTEVQQLFCRDFSVYSPIIQKAVRYIHAGVLSGSGISIKSFCAGNNMNIAYLGRSFKKETGYFFTDYLIQCRINRSIILLRNPNNNISEISEALGFGSVSYFVKIFREVKGVSPGKYRMGLDCGNK